MPEDLPTGELKLEKQLDLKSDFPIPSFQQWRENVERDLKGASYEKKLIFKTYEDINLNPIYTKNDLGNIALNDFPGLSGYLRGFLPSGYYKDSWDVKQEIITADVSEFNKSLLEALNNGQNCVNIELDSATKLGLDADYADTGNVGDTGLSISAINSMKRALNNLDISIVPIYMDAGFNNVPMLALMNAHCKANNIEISDLKGAITADPIGHLTLYGNLPVSLDYIFDMMKEAIIWSKNHAPLLKMVTVNTLPFADGGMNNAQELAIALSILVYYTNELSDREIKPKDILTSTQFILGIGNNYFMEISKFRAIRILLDNIANGYDVTTQDLEFHIGAKSTHYSQSKLDPYVNMLRTTTQAFSAILGGVNSLTTRPFDETIRRPDSFSRRIARNTQTILREESHLDAVIDAAGGSYYIENLTNELAKKSWEIFQSIEREGGIYESLKSGFIQNLANENILKRKKDIHKRLSVIVGTNMFADIKEKELTKVEWDHAEFQKKRSEYLEKFRLNGTKEKHELIMNLLNTISHAKSKDIIDTITEAYLLGTTLGEVSSFLNSSHKETIQIDKFSNKRASEDFEELRKRTLAYKEKNGELPKIFLLNYGILSEFKARADFSKGFFETGGFEVLESKGSTSIQEICEETINSNSKVAVICSTDEKYPEIVKPIVQNIKKEIPDMTIILAGYPKDQVDEHQKSGIDDFIFLGANVFEKLSSLLKRIGGEL